MKNRDLRYFVSLVICIVAIVLYGMARATRNCEMRGGTAVRGAFGGVVCVAAGSVLRGAP